MISDQSEYIDLHSQLLSYEEVLSYLQMIERNGDLRGFFKGANAGGRWLFQILSVEFVHEVSEVINRICDRSGGTGPVLEIMSGDGQFAKFLQPYLNRRIIATDAKDGRYNIAYPKWVETMDALTAVKQYDPVVTMVSWEPFLSTVGMELIEQGRQLIWIGQPGKCGHPDLFEYEHVALKSGYALGKFDSFMEGRFNTDVYLFNVSNTTWSV